jgi:membrane protease YdiL (CAAX protease family)
MARTSARFATWRPLLGIPLFVVAFMVSVLLLDVAGYAVGKALGRPERSDGTMNLGALGDTAHSLLAIAVTIPLVMLTLRWMERRPGGTVMSVAGRLRWKWQLTCFAVGLPTGALLIALTFLTAIGENGGGAEDSGGWAGWNFFLPALVMLVLLVPLQAAAEEVVFRGWLTQVVGSLTRHPWVPVVVQAPLFAAAHGWGTSSGFITLTYFGVVAGWLTYRTGGVEAAIGLHAASNLLSFLLGASIKDGLVGDETAADASALLAALDMGTTTLYALVVLWLARRWGVQRTRPERDFPVWEASEARS